MTIVRFDSTSYHWTRDDKSNLFFMRHTMEYCRERLLYRGYLYLNQIYESLGMPWDPDNENVCYRNSETFIVVFSDTEDGAYCIEIC